MPKTLLRYLDRYPDIIAAVTAHQSLGEPLTLELDTFKGDPFALYHAIWLAASTGVEVRFAPFSPPRKPISRSHA